MNKLSLVFAPHGDDDDDDDVTADTVIQYYVLYATIRPLFGGLGRVGRLVSRR